MTLPKNTTVGELMKELSQFDPNLRIVFGASIEDTSIQEEDDWSGCTLDGTCAIEIGQPITYTTRSIEVENYEERLDAYLNQDNWEAEPCRWETETIEGPFLSISITGDCHWDAS